jgi:hypothetical protein
MASNIVLAVMFYLAVKAMNKTWLEQLEMLLVCFSHLGIGADVASLSLIELWALYLHLSRLADG